MLVWGRAPSPVQPSKARRNRGTGQVAKKLLCHGFTRIRRIRIRKEQAETNLLGEPFGEAESPARAGMMGIRFSAHPTNELCWFPRHTMLVTLTRYFTSLFLSTAILSFSAFAQQAAPPAPSPIPTTGFPGLDQY